MTQVEMDEHSKQVAVSANSIAHNIEMLGEQQKNKQRSALILKLTSLKSVQTIKHTQSILYIHTYNNNT